VNTMFLDCPANTLWLPLLWVEVVRVPTAAVARRVSSCDMSPIGIVRQQATGLAILLQQNIILYTSQSAT